MTYTLGIDVGTTFTAAAVWRAGRAEVVELGNHSRTVPSVLFLRDGGEWLVGEAAERRAVTEPGRIAREFKRRLGDEVPLMLGDQRVTAEALTGRMIRWVTDRVTQQEGGPPEHVTITCPANWSDYRRETLVVAAAEARLGEVGLLTEPVAAAIYYATQERLSLGDTVGVYDLGGGTFDATVLRRTERGFELLGQPGGDEQLGGIDFDQAILDHLAATLGEHWDGLELSDPAVLSAVAQVRAHVVTAKEALSTDVETGIPVILPGVTREVRLTRAEFEEMIREPVLRTIEVFEDAVRSAGVEPRDLRGILLVGGSSRIPLITELIAGELGVPVTVDAHPKFAVCLGAAIAAAPRVAGADAAAPGAEPPPAAAAVPGTGIAADPVTTGIFDPADLLVRPDLRPAAEPAPGAAATTDPEATAPDLPPTARIERAGQAEPAAARAGDAPGGAAPAHREIPAWADHPQEPRFRWPAWMRPWMAVTLAAVLVAGTVAAVALAANARGGDATAGDDTDPTTATSPPTTTEPPSLVWSTVRINDLPRPMESPGVVAFDGQVWSIGGLGDFEGGVQPTWDNVYVYAPGPDPTAGAWTDAGIPPLPRPLSHVAAVSTGDELWVIGGWDESLQAVDTVLRLRKATNEWEPGPPLPAARGAGAAAWDGDRIVFGGGTTAAGTAAESDVWALRPGDASWQEVGNLQEPREHLAATSDGNGTVWFLGGRDDGGDSSSDRILLRHVDEVTGEGVAPADFSITPKQGHAAVFWPEVGVCVIGGVSAAADEPAADAAEPAEPGEAQGPTLVWHDDVECPQGAEGATLPRMSVGRVGAGAAVLGNDVYVVGGYPEGKGSDVISEVFLDSRTQVPEPPGGDDTSPTPTDPSG